MKELRIPSWTGICDANGKSILGLGNDLYQIGISIAKGLEMDVAKVTFNEADRARKEQYDIEGIIDLFPSLRDGITLQSGEITEVISPSYVSQHWQMADHSSAVLRDCLTRYVKPYIQDSLENDNNYEDALIIHLRGGDALDEWAQSAWRPSPASYEFYQDAIERSSKTKILIVTTPPTNGRMHPLVGQIRQDYDADVQHGTIMEDFSILINCTNLILDFSTFGYMAALMNTNLQSVFISKYVDKKGRPLLKDIRGDVGFTMPVINNCRVYVYDYPEVVVKSGDDQSKIIAAGDKSQSIDSTERKRSNHQHKFNASHVIMRERDVGLFSLFLQVVNTLQLTEQTDAVPMVWFGEGCAYFHPDGYHGKRTVWEYYFRPVDESFSEQDLLYGDIRDLEEIFENSAFTNRYYPRFASMPSEDRIPFLAEPDHHHRIVGSRIISQYIRPRDYIAIKVAAFYQKHLAGNFVIGLHLRGTDAIGSQMREQEIKVADYIVQAEACVREQKRRGVSSFRIFAAADDQKYIDSLKQHFGEALVCYDAIRKVEGPDKGRGPTGALMPHYVAKDPSIAAKNGEEVVIEYLLLCRSDFFVHNISSVSRAVLITCPYLASHNVQRYERTAHRNAVGPEPGQDEGKKLPAANLNMPETTRNKGVNRNRITVIQGGLRGSGLGSYCFIEIVGMIEDLLESGDTDFVVIPQTDHRSSYFPRDGTPRDNLWTTYFEPINPHLLPQLDKSELVMTDYNMHIHHQQGRIKAWPYREKLNCDLDSWFRLNRERGHAVVSRYFVPRRDILRRVDILWNECFGDVRPVLGLQLRGTDKLAAGGRRIVAPEEYFPYIESFLEENPDGSVFVATDDERFLHSLDQRGFPIHFQDAFRASAKQGLFDLAYEKGPEEHGREVMIDIYMLARCDYLVHSISSVVEAVMYVNLDLHDRSVNLEYANPQIPPWTVTA